MEVRHALTQSRIACGRAANKSESETETETEKGRGFFVSVSVSLSVPDLLR
jgi:hypothetical protein